MIYDKTTQTLSHTMEQKALKFVDLGCLLQINRNIFICKPIPNYNKTTYTITKVFTRDGFQLACNCQGFNKKAREMKFPYCSHTIALKIQLQRGNIKMGTIKEEAQAYIAPKQIKNISELDSVPTNFVLLNEEREDKDGKTYMIKYFEANGEKYRVPGKVLGDLKEILKHNENLENFKVAKVGSGFETKYTVIPL